MNVIMKKMRFAALDLECATSDTGNICELGLVVFEGTEEVYRFRSLVRPEVESFGDWQRWNFDYTLRDTLAAPRFPEVWKTIEPMIAGIPIVAHNAAMVECKHLSAAFSHHKMSHVEIPQLFCTLVLATQAWPDFPKHGIKSIARHFEWELDHHNPESDARVCGAVVIQLVQEKSFEGWQALSKWAGWSPCTFTSHASGRIGKDPSSRKYEPDFTDDLVAWEPTGEMDTLEPGHRFVLSGFSTSKKDTLYRQAKRKGLHRKNFISGSLHFLVADQRMGPAKYARCQAQGIPILSEDEFLERLEAMPEHKGGARG